MFKPAALAKWLSGLLTLAVLAACGFQLRGEHPVPFRTVAVQTSGYSELAEQLRRALREQGQAQVVADVTQAEAVVVLLKDSQEKNIISIDVSGRAREFELVRKLEYVVRLPNVEDPLMPLVVVAKRDLTYSDNQLLAKTIEEQQLYRDMQQDMIRQILRRMQAMQVSH